MHYSNSELAHATLLFQSQGSVGQYTTSSSQSTTVTSASTRSSPSASTVPKASTASMEIIRKSLESKKHFRTLCRDYPRILALTKYQTHINKWLNYCCERKLGSLHPSVADVTRFLTTLFEKDLSYSSLNTARSTLSTIISVDGMSIGSHPLVVRFLIGVFNLRPPVPRHKEMWDVSIVLRFLKAWLPETLSLKNLTLKLVMLFSSVTAQRGKTLHLLDISLMSTYDWSIVFAFSKLLNRSYPRTRLKPLVLKAYIHDESLCFPYFKRVPSENRDSSCYWFATVNQSSETS